MRRWSAALIADLNPPPRREILRGLCRRRNMTARLDDYLILGARLTRTGRSGRLGIPAVAGFADQPRRTRRRVCLRSTVFRGGSNAPMASFSPSVFRIAGERGAPEVAATAFQVA